MPCSQTPVVNRTLAMAHTVLLLSVALDLVSFHLISQAYPMTTTSLFSGLNHTAYTLDPLSFALPLPVLHVSFTTGLPAQL